MRRSSLPTTKSQFKNKRHSVRRKLRSNRHRRNLAVEALEGRAMLAPLVAEVLSGTFDTTVSGTVYEDLDSNGAKSPGESGIPNWTVYLDLDSSGTLNHDAVGTPEPSAVTNKDGDYLIRYLKPGNYRLAEVVPSGWSATSPVSLDVQVTEGRDTKADFFNFGGGEIVGTVWNDLNNSGIRDTDPITGAFTEPGLKDWTIFLDLDNSKSYDPGEPVTLTDANGEYSFRGLPAGDYEVFEELPTGWEAAKGFDNKQTATVVALQQTSLDFANIGIGVGSMSGTIWHDVNLDGVRNADPATGEYLEPGLADWTVFLDSNNNGSADPSEPSTVTNARGEYSFISLAEGDYEVTEVLPSGWDVAPDFDIRQTVTVSAGKESVASDFANFSILDGSIRGVIWNDLNRNGLRDKNLSGVFTEPGLSGWTVYLDRNGNRVADPSEPSAVTDFNGTYLFSGLQVGDYDVRQIIPSGWEVAPTFSDSETVTVFSGTESIAPDFANFNILAASPGSIRGTVWNDLNGNGLRDLTSVSEPGLPDWTVFIDSNSNGLLDTGEPQSNSAVDGSYSFSGILPGSVSIVAKGQAGWRATAPRTSVHTIALKNGQEVVGLDFGNQELKDSSIRGVAFADTNRNDVRDAGERGLAGITVYLDVNNNKSLDADEPQTVTLSDQFFTPEVDEAGTYSFSHLAKGSYTVRMIVPAVLSATPVTELEHSVTLTAAEDHSGVDCAAVYRRNEIHGVKFNDLNGNHQRDSGEPGMEGSTIFLDLDRDDLFDDGEPSTITLADGSYAFTDLSPGAYVVREISSPGYERTYPTTLGGTLWPSGVSNPAVGNVNPLSISASLAAGEILNQTVSLTLPTTGALTNLVDVFLLFDDTGSFVNNSPIVRAAFPDIITRLQTALPGIDLGFGVGRLEEYGSFAAEYATGRPFILNQPIVAASTAGYLTAIQAALNRTTPGYGGDQPETDIEALYQVVTGLGFDGNNNGSVLDSGLAGLASTQLNPGASGDVPSFASFVPDPSASVMPAAGTVGGVGFRAGALPIILTATDTGFAYQPQGETTITGVGGLSLPISSLTGTSRPTTPFNSGAGIQETITALNALGALVIGLGTNPQANVDPRQALEALSKLTGAINQSTATIANGTTDPIAPGDPLYFQIASGFSASVANGVVSAIQNAVTSVAVNVTLQASDPRVKIINHTGVINGVSSGQSATFNIDFVGDGVPHRFDLQFVRAGTNVVLGSIPVVLGTPVPGNGYEFEDLEEGEIEIEDDFGNYLAATVPSNVAPSFTAGANQFVAEDSDVQIVAGWATNISPGPASESSQVVHFVVSNDHDKLFEVQPAISPDGTLTFKPALNAYGFATVSVQLHDNGGIANGGVDASAIQRFEISISAVNDAPSAANEDYTTSEDVALTIDAAGVLANDSDIEGDALSAAIVSRPTHGSVTLNANGSFVYVPAINFHGADSFTYKSNDGLLDSAEATVGISVGSVNDAPSAANEDYTTSEDVALTIDPAGVLANDSDIEGDTLSAAIVSRPTHGSVTLNTNGSFVYVPAANFHGADSFTYKADDGLLDSAEATVGISVGSVNDAPNAANEDYTTSEDVALTIDAAGVLANDSDIEGDALSAAIVSGPTHGSVTLNTNGSFVYVPAINFHGADSFTYKANDGLLDSAEATVAISVGSVNDAPVGVNDTFAVDQGTELVVPVVSGVLMNDSDVDGDSLVAQLISGPNHGSLALNEDGSFTYTPAAGYFGMDAFEYQVTDSLLASANTTVSIDVRYVAPVGSTKFIVVDRSVRDTFEYDAAGNLVKQSDLSPINRTAQGITTNADGSLRWVVDSHGAVFVYDQAGKLTGLWIAKGIDKPEGIATNGRDLWIVDRDSDRVYFFANAADRRSGISRPTGSFRLDHSNRNPMDVTTDGVHLWVVDDTSSVDRVFRYSVAGKLEGKWTIDRANSHPTGLTIDPNDVNHIWIVDARTDRVYQYGAAATRLSGSQLADSSFSLATSNRNPQGIADPRPAVAKKREPVSDSAFPLVVVPPTETARHYGTHPVSHLVTSRVTLSSSVVNEETRPVHDSKHRSEHTTEKMESISRIHDDALAEVMNDFDDLSLNDSMESLLWSARDQH